MHGRLTCGELRRALRRPFVAGLLAVCIGAAAGEAQAQTVINLTQVACQFIESENGADRMFTSKRSQDCDAINAKTGAARLAESEALTLKPGRYVFRVTNKNVPYELGFWLREHDYSPTNPLHRVRKISVSGGGLEPGKTRDYVVDLKPGEYLYSCPLNTTPDYKLVVAK